MRDRLHWIVLRGVLLLLVAGGLLGIPLMLFQAVHSYELSWTVDLGTVTELPRGLFVPAHDASANYLGQADIGIIEPDARLSVLSVLPDVLLAAAMAYVAFVLLLLVLRIQEGRTFAGNGARLLRSAAIVIATAAVLIPLARIWADREILASAGHLGPRLGGGPAQARWDLNGMFIWLLVALLVLAVSRAYREGERLAEETEGLV